jgi:lysophospholipase-3
MLAMYTFHLPFLFLAVPGDGGSQFKAKLDKPTTVASYCIKKTDYYYDLWLNLEQLVPFLIDCFVDNMR